jgi:RimJ/RimL family protein N-acetyltransferase
MTALGGRERAAAGEPLITTERLVLRIPRLDDAERVAELLDNFAVAGNLSRVPYPYRLSDARAYLKSRRPGLPPAETSFAIDLPGAGFVGQIGYHTDHHGHTVLGYYLGQPYWGRGIMSEAARAVVDWYFTATTGEVLRSGVFFFNAPSLAIQKKLGFLEIGTSSLLCLARGEEVRHIDTELVRANWAARRP